MHHFLKCCKTNTVLLEVNKYEKKKINTFAWILWSKMFGKP